MQDSNDNNELPRAGKKELAKLFEEAAQIEANQHIKVSANETEQAFRSVSQKIHIESRSGAIFKASWLRYAAAAIFLLCALGIAYLFTPHEITVAYGATQTIQLSDQTSITLNSGSTLTYPRWFGWGERSVTLQGEAFFEVTTTGEPFRVITQNAQITVLGTRFNVRSWPHNTQHKTSVFLKEGRISFAPKNRQKQAIILEPGQHSWISSQQPMPATPQKMDPARAIAWLQHGLSFENQPLSVIFEELSRRFNVTIRVRSDHLLQEKLTIYFPEVDGIEQVLQDICKAKGLDYLQKDNTFIISQPSS